MNIFTNIVDLLAEGENFVLALVLTRTGSAPRSAGARMIIRTDGSIIGTVGGGVLEAAVRRMAVQLFQDKKSRFERFALDGEGAGRIGMICGGNVEVMLQFLDSSASGHLDLYRELAAALGDRKRAWLITRIGPDNEKRFPAQCLISDNSLIAGEFEYGPEVISELAKARGYLPVVVETGFERFLVEPLSSMGTVYIFGAGHVGQALASLTGQVGFRTVVLDDREEFANRQRLSSADEVVVLKSFAKGFDGLHIGQDSYIVILTRGHVHDGVVLSRALKTSAGYIGMIGSRRKRDVLYDSLGREGFTADDFKRVHSPIGLAIGAETPEEIAVSILAELIQSRAGKNK
ncbi:MAG: XdhC family aldehyde oxidoreductase maturation factor [Syntrophobacteraceae bacterium]